MSSSKYRNKEIKRIDSLPDDTICIQCAKPKKEHQPVTMLCSWGKDDFGPEVFESYIGMDFVDFVVQVAGEAAAHGWASYDDCERLEINNTDQIHADVLKGSKETAVFKAKKYLEQNPKF